MFFCFFVFFNSNIAGKLMLEDERCITCTRFEDAEISCLGESEAGSRGGGLGLGSAGRVAAESWNVANDFADERLVLNALRPP